jgi:AraC-like DNA-binding protein
MTSPLAAIPVRRPTVAAGYARGLADFAVSRGADRDALLAAAGIAAADLEDHDGRLPFSRYVALMAGAKRLTGDPALALHYGQAVPLAQVSVVGLLGAASETAMDAFNQLNRYARLVIDLGGEGRGDRFRLALEEGDLWLVDTWAVLDDFPELGETAFASMVTWVRGFGEGVRAVHFRHSAPAHSAEYEAVFKLPVVFDSGRNALLLLAGGPSAKVATMPTYAAKILSERAEALLAELPQGASVRSQVESRLSGVLHTAAVDLTHIARSLGMSRATLTRRLAGEGVTFTAVLDDLRRRLALEHLRKTSVKETAYLLGFSDPAAFSRAFKRWTGRTPRAVRGEG